MSAAFETAGASSLSLPPPRLSVGLANAHRCDQITLIQPLLNGLTSFPLPWGSGW